MTPPTSSALDVALPLVRYALDVVLSISLPLVVQLADKRWLLTDEQRSGAWNTVSWASALYNFGPFSMIGWVCVTRHQWRRWRALGGLPLACALCVGLFFAGALAAVPVVAIWWGLDQLAALALGLKP